MVLVAADGGLCSLLQNLVVGRVGQVLVTISKGHLVDDIEAQRVCQFVEARLAWIVGGTDIVDRGFLHQPHVLQRERIADDLHRPRVCGMAGDTAQFDGFPIQFQHLAVNGQFADAETVFKGLYHPALLQKLCAQGVEVRSLGRPQVRIVDTAVCTTPHHLPPCVKNLMGHRRLPVTVGHLGFHHNLARHLRSDGQVAEVRLGHGKQGHVAKDAAGCPVVVRIEVATLRLGHHTQCQLLFLGLGEIGRDVEECRIVGRSPRTDQPTVHPQIVGIEHTVEAQYHALAMPRIWHGEGGAIVARQCQGLVVTRFAETVRFPASGYGNSAPGGISRRDGLVIADTVHHL